MRSVRRGAGEDSAEARSHGERIAIAIARANRESAPGAAMHDEAAPLTDGKTEAVLGSWLRSAEHHRVDPESDCGPRILTGVQVREAREPLQQMLGLAQSELDGLYGLVRGAGYSLVLSDSQGIALEERDMNWTGTPGARGTWLGSVWTEDVEGTNAVGTSLVELRAVSIHQQQHFRARHTALSCSAAPIFAATGELLAILDLTSLDPELSVREHSLSLPLVCASVDNIEERLFREHFRDQWVIALSSGRASRQMLLLAVDGEQCIVGANRPARVELGLTEAQLQQGVVLSSFCSHERAPFRRSDGTDRLIHLKWNNSGRSQPAIVSSPTLVPSSNLSIVDASLRMRSRRSLLVEVQRAEAAQPSRGGLSAAVLRRVCSHIEEYLHENISLETLAQQAGLSVHHFARAFKREVGMPPHRYLLEQRVARAKELLAATDSTVADVAHSVGFTDQSHFARHFVRLTGWTPSAFRRAQR